MPSFCYNQLMVRLKIIKSVENFRAGQTVQVDEKVAKFLLKNRYAIKSKDMTANDYEGK
jgi:hypothetical protein